MMIFKKSIPRRSFLRGAGAAIALPLLDAMVPALAAVNETAKAVRRFSIVYVPNGMNMKFWTPAATGKSYALPQTLEPLSAYKEQMLVLSGMNNNAGDALPGEGESAPHERAGGVFLTGVHPLREGHVGTSIDQIIARELGQHTQLASLELGLHNTDVVGSCEKGWSCAYRMTLCWRSATTPLPVEYRPRAVFERLFGDSSSTDAAVRLARIEKERSILDSVTAAASRLMQKVGAEDKARLSEYLDGMRDVERRIQMAEQQNSREIPSVERPAGIPAEFVDHLKLMFDLQVLAFQTDMTRMITFMTGPEQSNRTYREIGIPDVHHSLSHHRNDPVNLEKIARIDLYHSQLFTYYLDKLRTTQDIDGSLLDNMIIMYGSAMSDGNEHLLQDLPILLLGGGTGKLKGGRHIRYPEDTPISNLYLTIMDKLGLQADKFGDSTGKLDLLSV
ncbi:MAG: DUF1552 domain-containing protein [Gammaproteobacteria bacterium]|nr:DUF1552 domain-containing protein [Gammaproteobacteria bacterium]MDH3546046.1 DUF1552 domain-containing protein [Gammaproteobacteria bacterium]